MYAAQLKQTIINLNLIKTYELNISLRVVERTSGITGPAVCFPPQK